MLSSKHVLRLVCGTGTAGGFVFPLLQVCFCRAVQADFVRRLLSVPFALSAHRFLCVWSETVNVKANTSVDEPDSTR